MLTSGGKTNEKKIGGPKLGLNFGFLPFSQVCIISFPFRIAAWNNV